MRPAGSLKRSRRVEICRRMRWGVGLFNEISAIAGSSRGIVVNQYCRSTIYCGRTVSHNG
jgi:hypothetical protein